MTDPESLDQRLSRLRDQTAGVAPSRAVVERWVARVHSEGQPPQMWQALYTSGRRALLLAALLPVVIGVLVWEAQDSLQEAEALAVEWLP